MKMDRYDHGVPSWVDFSSPDVPASSAFYGALLAWNVEQGPPEAGGYSMAMLHGAAVAGIGPQMNPGMPPAWTTYVNVDDADDVVAKITANGGQVFVAPMEVLDVGRMAIFADPSGAVLGLWQPRTHTGAGLVNEPGAYCWSELITTDVDRATAFYGAVFGWGALVHENPTTGSYTEWQLGGRSIGGMMPKPPTMPAEVPPFWGVYFAVDDCDASAARITELGGALLVPPTDIDPGRFAAAVDPQGGMFSILAMKAGD
jgi:predicted enzyme related to lactoylglutathione lyase